MRSAAPVAATDGGAIAGHPAERRGRAHGAAGVSADGGYRRTLLHARHRSTGRPAGECARIAWLHAIAKLRILAGNTIGQRMKMSFAHDHCAGGAQLLHQPGVARGRAVQIAVKAHAARGRRAGEVEAVLHRDRQTPQRGAAVAERAAIRARHRLGTRSFRARPRGILPQVRVAAGISAAACKRRLSQLRRTCGPVGECSAKSAKCPREGSHTEIVGAAGFKDAWP